MDKNEIDRKKIALEVRRTDTKMINNPINLNIKTLHIYQIILVIIDLRNINTEL